MYIQTKQNYVLININRPYFNCKLYLEDTNFFLQDMMKMINFQPVKIKIFSLYTLLITIFNIKFNS